jgi:hypothetical protein
MWKHKIRKKKRSIYKKPYIKETRVYEDYDYNNHQQGDYTSAQNNNNNNNNNNNKTIM